MTLAFGQNEYFIFLGQRTTCTVCVGWRCGLEGDWVGDGRPVYWRKPVCLYFNNDIRVISDLHTSVKPNLKNTHTTELNRNQVT